MEHRLFFRMLAPTLAVSLVLLLLGGAAAWYVHYLQQDSAITLRVNVAKVAAAEELVTAGHDLRHELALYLATSDRKFLIEAASQRVIAAGLLRECQHLAMGNDAPELRHETELLAEVEHGLSLFSTRLDAALAESAPSRESLLGLIDEVGSKVLEPVARYRKRVDQDIHDAARKDEQLADEMELGLFVFGVCGAVAGLLAGFSFARSVHRSIVQLTVPIHDAAGKLNEVVGPIKISGENLDDLESTLQAISRQVESVVEQLHESHAVARRSEQMASLGQLATGIAHELRNPLTAMKIIVQTALDQQEEGSFEPLDAKDLRVLAEETTRLEATIQSFLNYARPPKPAKRSVHLRDEMARTASFLQHRAEQIGVRIEEDFQADIPDQVEADADQLRQVLLNLVLNAMDVAPSGSVIRMELTRSASAATGQSGLLVAVQDEGPGLPADLKDHIFEPFVTSKDSGTGLGLAICQRIAEDHGWTLEAADRPGGGAEFTIWLPDPSPRTPLPPLAPIGQRSLVPSQGVPLPGRRSSSPRRASR